MNRVVQLLKEESKNNIQKYVNEKLPATFDNTLNAINQIIKITWESIDRAHSSNNSRDEYPALSLLMQAYEIELHLLSSAETLKEAVSFVDSHNQQREQDNETKTTRES